MSRLVCGLVLCVAVTASSAVGAKAASRDHAAALSVIPVSVPLGKFAGVGAGWRVKVDLASPALWIVDGHALPVDGGNAEFLLRVSVRWSGGGSSNNVRGLLKRMWLQSARGSTSTFYSPQVGAADIGCALKQTPKQWRNITTIRSGRVTRSGTLTGQVCFQVDPGDRASLELRVNNPSCTGAPLQAGTCTTYIPFKLR